jgi:hypothetical protein
MELLKSILTDSTTMEKFNDNVRVWENRAEIMLSIISQELISKHGFELAEEEYVYAVKPLKENNLVALAFCYEDYDKPKRPRKNAANPNKKANIILEFGFSCEEESPKELRAALAEILKNKEFQFGINCKELGCVNDWWVLNQFEFEFNQPVSEIISFLVNKYDILERQTIEALKSLKPTA